MANEDGHAAKSEQSIRLASLREGWDGFAKGHLSSSKRPSFTRWKAMFCVAKDGLLQHIDIQDVMRQACNGVPGGSGQPCTQAVSRDAAQAVQSVSWNCRRAT